MDIDRLTRTLKAEEGTRRMANGRHRVYMDTMGRYTIGFGRNLSDVGISDNEAAMLLANDIHAAIDQLTSAFPWFSSLDDVRQRVLADMAFNQGLGDSHAGLLSFHKMLTAVSVGDYDLAADEMLDSQWADEVKGRALVLAEMMRSGADPIS